jgi:hypothetical protein
MGARHAESILMLTNYTWNADPEVAAALLYKAKKDAETAPGVGVEYDMYMTTIKSAYRSVSPAFKDILEKASTRLQTKLERLYDKYIGDVQKELKALRDTSAQESSTHNEITKSI